MTIRDFTDEEARRAIPCKWGQVDADVIPAWVAEMDYALAPVIEQSVVAALRLGMAGYPAFHDDGAPGLAAPLAEHDDRSLREQVGNLQRRDLVGVEAFEPHREPRHHGRLDHLPEPCRLFARE